MAHGANLVLYYCPIWDVFSLTPPAAQNGAAISVRCVSKSTTSN